jgi:hypothetical protein
MSNPYAPPKVDSELPTRRLLWLKLGVLLAALGVGQAGIIGSVLVAEVLCVAGGAVDAHTAGDEFVLNICRPGVGAAVFVGVFSVVLWAVGYFVARTVVRRHKERQGTSGIQNVSIG